MLLFFQRKHSINSQLKLIKEILQECKFVSKLLWTHLIAISNIKEETIKVLNNWQFSSGWWFNAVSINTGWNVIRKLDTSRS